ncbi:Uncharacterised protein [Streptococcus pneumoniae]|uniref:hypothetical protein n=1 Tax=Streptococcus pneumoniae TaxID=1313 RepID=UPI0010241F20|nr:hypothetical protein [Streptococcus pneumoniae]VFH94767.1 Uncharacterised protein [Streptococcus pneumoniae]VIS54438.1 Uncharacterised protein [Streptococcus pneumoniae]VJK20154.1 Uncharacterised protein [Streptococcus pneumoniae]VJO58898.1 Uncharacterised protein [Streptococcus pneumoniae]VJP02329.1 Uncharacterised protein [Streptococcus pneumoniae]
MSMVSEKWLSLFNNIEDDEQLDDFLKTTSGDSLQDWEKNFFSTSSGEKIILSES